MPGYATKDDFPESVVVDFPFECTKCGRTITEKSQLKPFKGYSGKNYLIHEGPGCLILVKDLPQHDKPQQTMLRNTEKEVES